ncbi:MAG TPA: DUF5995 family protein, partial [Mycobacteriales bacterium]|nr:DUF5995 family protein [Mycobacteriales bacterium]
MVRTDDGGGGTPPDSIADVVARMAAIEAALPPGDGVACFDRMYLQVTELVRDRIGAGYFADPDAMTALDVTFAELFLAAVDAADAGQRVPRAWAPLFARRAAPRVLAVQFAIAGMNAHINHDLPIAVVTTCEQRGLVPAAIHDDYLRVNALLGSIEQQVRQSFEDEVVRTVDRDLSPVLDLLGNWSIDKAREAAWVNADVLWRLRDVAV